MNNWDGIGNLTKDVEERVSGDGMSVSKFTIAIDDGYGDKKTTDYINIVVFGKQAESCAMYLKKGSKCAVTGKISTGSYTNKDGVKIYTTEIIASRVEFLTGKSDSAPSPAPEVKQAELPAGMTYAQVDDSEIPW